MPFRRLPDGSMLDTDTGALVGSDLAREAAARQISERAGYRKPVVSKGQQIMDVTQVDGKNVITPVERLAISPYSAMGETPGVKTMSDSTKRLLMIGGVLAAAYGFIWVQNKFKGKK